MGEIDYLYNVAVEVTRRCNLECTHCMRGNAEDVDLKIDHWSTLLRKVDRFGTVTLTGGEPLLKPDILYEMTQYVYDQYQIGDWYMATNATIFGDDQERALDAWMQLVPHPDTTGVDISNDEWHRQYIEGTVPVCDQAPHAHDALMEWGYKWPHANGASRVHFKYGRLTQGPGYVIDMQPKPHDLVATGRWKGGSPRLPEPDTLRLRIEGDQRGTHEGILLMNVYGDIFAGCDLSFQDQRDKLGYICHVDDLSWAVLEACEHSTYDEY